MLFADKIISFLKDLELNAEISPAIKVMNPFKNKDAMRVCAQFYKKYYSDANKRRMIIGINPGRFGGGVTGVPFTDPIRLEKECGIENHLQKKQELSSLFIYDVVNAFGGPQKFYKSFYITSVSPLGFTKDTKNLNYYDDKDLEDSIKDFVITCMNTQLNFGIDRRVAFCLGEGKNYTYLSKLNKENKFFDQITPLSHPRFIMQYKLKSKEAHIQSYLKKFIAS